MVRDERYIKERFGQENPFKVPDGYFEKFADQMMNQLPDKQTGTVKVHRNVWSSVRPALMVAASVLVLLLSTFVYFDYRNHQNTDAISSSQKMPNESSSEVSVDQFTFLSMMDNEDIYEIVSDN